MNTRVRVIALIQLAVVPFLVLSIFGTQFLGRQLTVGDFFGVCLLLLFVGRGLMSRVWRLKYFAFIEQVWFALLVVMLIVAILNAGMANGTFLNGFRTLLLSLVAYISGRRLVDNKNYLIRALIAVYIGFAVILIYVRADIIGKFSEDPTHLVGYESSVAGVNVTNLNAYGLIWSCLAASAVIFYLKFEKRHLAYLAAVIPVPFVLFSLSRSAYLMYVVTICSLAYYAMRYGRKSIIDRAFLLVGAFMFAVLSYYYFSGLGSRDRISSKFDSFWDELFAQRLGVLMWRPIFEAINSGGLGGFLLGNFDAPQHNSIANYFVMFGIFGLLGYLAFILVNFRVGLYNAKARLPRYISSRDASLLSFSVIFFAVGVFNDLATNLFFYYPPFAYLFFFLIGCARPNARGSSQQLVG